MKVARHEVPGIRKKESVRPGGTVRSGSLVTHRPRPKDAVEDPVKPSRWDGGRVFFRHQAVNLPGYLHSVPPGRRTDVFLQSARLF